MVKKFKILSWRDVVLKLAESPIKFGKPTKRKVCLIGPSYYYPGMPCLSVGDVPDLMEEFGIADLPGLSILVNVYPNTDAGIGWHCDTTKPLQEGSLVHSVSVPLTGDVPFMTELATMDFRFKAGGHAVRIPLISGELFTFDPFKDEMTQRQHRVSGCSIPRINITWRYLKPEFC